ncbi:Uncharacterized protein FWK35_00004033 [Aphis craccivora]|uniref:Uncharacterized protein n=1 Tax=Aphis craccivora TaxID=307492 RepID=A0A6G0Z6C2_APHCR|nr:Uncharacterized protein FWK35_00004033 [Aphis craccivora]
MQILLIWLVKKMAYADKSSPFRIHLMYSRAVSTYSTYPLLDSERSDECVDFTMMCVITTRNNDSILNFRDSFRWQNEYPWCIIEVKSKHLTFSNSFQKN